MFDIRARDDVPPAAPRPLALQFLSIEVMPTTAGEFSVSVSGTYLDERELEFINDEIECARAESAEDVVNAIRRALSAAFPSEPKKEH